MIRGIPFLLMGIAPLAAQTFDTSANGSLRGDYFVREVLIAGQNPNGTITSATAVIGVITFDGAGHYQFSGQQTLSASLGSSSAKSSTGTYGAAANGLLEITSLIDATQTAYGGIGSVGPNAFIASATENGVNDILVAIPAGANVSASALKGAYSAGYIDFLNADVSMIRQSTFALNADGAGNLGNVAVSGTAVNLNGVATKQTVSGATYALAGGGSGTLNLGAASSSQLISGTKTFYLSADGNIALAANPAGFDLMIAIRALSAPANNSTWTGLYFTGGFEDAVSNSNRHALGAFYGSWNALGSVSLAHSRYQTFSPRAQVFDYTLDTQYSVQPDGTVAPLDLSYQFTLGANGNAFIATGTSGLYSLFAGFGVQRSSGSGVYIFPTGILNAGTYSPVTNPIAPNEIITIFGAGLASTTATAPTVPLPTSLGGTMVTINGINAPLFYVSPQQITAQVPQAITPGNNVFFATVRVINNGVLSNGVTMYTSYTSPGVFTAGANGINGAAATHANGSLITSSSSAAIGETVVLYATGLGAVSPAVQDGAGAPGSQPFAMVTDLVTVDLGGQQATLPFAGLTPGAVALYQLNTKIATGTGLGTQFVNISTPDAVTSQATIPISGAMTAGAMTAGDRSGLAALRRQALAAHVSRRNRQSRPRQ